MKRTVAITLLSLCTALLPCCSNECEWTITYKLTGTAAEVGVEFNNKRGDTESYSSVPIPMEYTFDIEFGSSEQTTGVSSGDVYPAYIRAWVNGIQVGWITVEIYVNGKLVRTGSSTPGYDLTAMAHYGVQL